MKRQRLVSQGALSRMFAEAAAAWREQDYDKTIDLLDRAARLDPANASIRLDLARAQGLRYDYAAAEASLDKAISISPGVETMIEAARGCQEFGHYPLALKFFRRTLEKDPNRLEALLPLADLLERGHRIEEATELIERARHLRPEDPRPLVSRARLHRLASNLPEAERLLRHCLAHSGNDRSQRIRAWYELGMVLDRQNRFDEAMTAFLEAKSEQRPAAATQLKILQGIQARVREMEETMTAEVLLRWSRAGSGLGVPKRLAILCGHPRSGTTLLEQVLDSHPEIVTAEETHILHDEAYLPLSRGFPATASLLEVLDSSPPSRLQKSRNDYFRCTEQFIAKTIGTRLLVDKNPALNVLIPAVVRLFPEASFLVALRDPRDVCLSCFMQPLALNPVSSGYLSLEGTATQYASVMGFWKVILQRLPNPWMEVRYEELVTDIETASRRVFAFLNVPWNPAVLQFHEHAKTKPVRSPSYAEVIKPVHHRAIGRWKNYEKFLEPYLNRLDPFIDRLGYR